MKKIILSALGFSVVLFYSCTNNQPSNNTIENKTMVSKDTVNKEVWAELVESKTILIKPDGWDDDYWNAVNKKMDSRKIFDVIVNSVISGKVKAYNILTDSVLTIDEVKAIIDGEGGSDKKIGSDDLSAIRMREKWVFDKEKFKLEKHVTRIDLLYKKTDETGEYIGDKPLFYVNLND